MTKEEREETIKTLTREKASACIGCMHPQQVGYCEEVCQIPKAYDAAIEMLNKPEVVWIVNDKGEGISFKDVKVPKVLQLCAVLNDEFCEDCISREDALMALTCEIKDGDTIESMIGKFGERIRNLPTVQPKRVKGEWVEIENNICASRKSRYKCSKCGQRSELGNEKFCPNCGAEMEE